MPGKRQNRTGTGWRNSPLYRALLPVRLVLEFHAWRAKGCTGAAPRLVKHRLVRDLATQQHLRVLVETGTYLGTMVAAVKQCFDAIYSVELDPGLAASAARRFARAKHVTIVEGDSAVRLAAVLDRLDQPALFWLDAHFSGGATASTGADGPVLHEIELISRHRLGAHHSILIDDARLFSGVNGYPPVARLFELIADHFPRHDVDIDRDVIVITPQSTRSSTANNVFRPHL